MRVRVTPSKAVNSFSAVGCAVARLACPAYKPTNCSSRVAKRCRTVNSNNVKTRKPMVNKRGRFGRFLACSDYPACKTTKPVTLKGIACPEDGGGLAERKKRFGKSFWGCVNYPNCKFASWDRPLPEKCPQCASQYLVSKYSKRDGAYIACPNKECGYRREAPEQAGPEQAQVPF